MNGRNPPKLGRLLRTFLQHHSVSASCRVNCHHCEGRKKKTTEKKGEGTCIRLKKAEAAIIFFFFFFVKVELKPQAKICIFFMEIYVCYAIPMLITELPRTLPNGNVTNTQHSG